MKRKNLTDKQKAALRKGANLMYKAQKLQKESGTKTRNVKAAGKWQKLEVYKMPLNDALKKVSR
jgi:hypothetical protein